MRGIILGALITTGLLSHGAYAQSAAPTVPAPVCIPSTTAPVNVCVGLSCSELGQTTIDGDGTNIIACLKPTSTSTSLIWKSVVSSSSSSSSTGGSSTSNLTTNGYEILSDGLILQWGTYTGTTGRYSGDKPGIVINLPIPFPNACLNSTTSLSDRHYTNGDKQWDWGISCSTTTVTLNYYFESNPGEPTFHWFAIGH